jgi:hypothetical protein
MGFQPDSSDDLPKDHGPSGEPKPANPMNPWPFGSEFGAAAITTYTYDFASSVLPLCDPATGERRDEFTFSHNQAKGEYLLSVPDGTVERFRHIPARYLVAEPDPNSGSIGPAVRHGLPVYLYLCREQREP